LELIYAILFNYFNKLSPILRVRNLSILYDLISGNLFVMDKSSQIVIEQEELDVNEILVDLFNAKIIL
jgi:hypothetical protein